MNFVNNEYNAGLAAKAAGQPRNSNPYTDKGAMAASWYRGWDAGIPPTTAPPVTTVTPAPPNPNPTVFPEESKVEDGQH